MSRPALPDMATGNTQRRKDARARERFIEAVAHLLSDRTAAKSVMLQVEAERSQNDPMPKFAAEWAAVRNAIPGMNGYMTLDETRVALKEFLS